jgi:hypothetical protein
MGLRDFEYCCGLMEVEAGQFAPDDLREAKRSVSAVIATTVPSQRQAIKALKASGFVALRRFKNGNSGNTVTLWYRNLRGIKIATGVVPGYFNY